MGDELSKFDRVFVDIDTQVDFLDPAGKLYVPGAVELLGAFEQLFSYASKADIPVLSPTDDHAPDDPEFAHWPAHCVHGTPGQQKIPLTLMPQSIIITPDADLAGGAKALLAEYDQLIFSKPTLDAFDNPYFARLVEELTVGEYVVFGVATDYCVLLAATGLLERGCRVKIVRDAVRAVAKETGEKACHTLSALGAEWVQTADLVKG